MIAVIVIGSALVFGIIVLLVLALRGAMNRRLRARAQWAQNERQVHLVERRLHGMASRAFAAMLDAARDQSSGGCQGHR